jgi:membrane protein
MDTNNHHDTPPPESSDTSDVASQVDRGRRADRPSEIPARGWLDVSWRAARRFSDDNVTLVAGGLAMYALLSVFPALAATVSIYGMFTTPADVIKQMGAFAGVLPPGVWDIFNTQLQSIAKTGQSTLTFAALLGIVVALWSARSAMSSLMTATNIAYREREKRSFIKQTLLSLAFTVGALLGFVLMLTLGVAIPLALAAFGAEDWTKAAVSVLRLALLWGVMVLALAVVYRYAPAREHARWRWVSAGSLIAATLWMGASGLFAFYVTNFAGYAKTYGALGGVVVLLMWFFISSIVVVLGAQINAELERQTIKDTTDLRDAPLGGRGAFAADTVGPRAASDKAATENKPLNGAPSEVGTPTSEPPKTGGPTEAQPNGRGLADAQASGRGPTEVQPKNGRLAALKSWTGGPTGTRPPPGTLRPSTAHAADASALIHKIAAAANPTASKFGRITAAASAVRLGARLLPVALQLLRRHPVASSLAVATLIWAVKPTRPQGEARLRRHS